MINTVEEEGRKERERMKEQEKKKRKRKKKQEVDDGSKHGRLAVMAGVHACARHARACVRALTAPSAPDWPPLLATLLAVHTLLLSKIQEPAEFSVLSFSFIHSFFILCICLFGARGTPASQGRTPRASTHPARPPPPAAPPARDRPCRSVRQWAWPADKGERSGAT